MDGRFDCRLEHFHAIDGRFVAFGFVWRLGLAAVAALA